ncbi:GNAT family N-acetyltransferase [Curtobacterium sp. VKM Ac-1376]|uniref:GNAT family N-acetyltransferase n=1 Tax=Curtobacterium sp. VKM Ac-1376 TaxID=123312 RepID=UPI00188B04F7|nr:GNAT family N-acetyltransferase [Curtobacterium sp. VKM Ac-1376]MBF4613088.1 GNAT family N-acetyltransferase [Curtobacterium sp. VKM Ac-1376]
MPGNFSFRTTTERDWERVRALRIENATDNPVSYGATLEYTRRMTEDDWRLRAVRGEAADTTSVVAIDDGTGRWIGMMSGQVGDAHGADPVLTGVYVTPEFRGHDHGVADALLDHVLTWAAGHGDALRLEVYDQAVPAGRFYARRGFRPTGRSRDFHVLGDRLDAPTLRLIELSRALRNGQPRT